MSGTPVRTSGAGAHRAAEPAAGRRSWSVPAVIAVATLVALGLRVYQLSRPGYLYGITEYDDGTDFGSAIRLVHGYLPYRDFIMVQPPGITLLMAPVALITKGVGTATGMAVGRVLTVLASTAAVPLAGLLTRHRGLLAVILTCGIVAVYPDSLVASKTVLLEPWLVLFCLLGALAVFDGDKLAGGRRLLIGGCAFGFAGAVKVWAILPVLVILALTARRPRRAGTYAAGVAAGFLVPVLPFALAAPSLFYRGVIVAQLIRSDVTRVGERIRLQHILGLSHAPQVPTGPLAGICIVVAAAIAAAWWYARRHAGPAPALDWFAAVTCLLVVVAFLWPADFYPHYTAFLAPFLALAIALPASRLLAVLRSGGASGSAQVVTPRTAERLSRLSAGVAAVTLAVFAVLLVGAESRLVALVSASEISATERAIPPGSCVLTDQVSYTIGINRFVSNVPGCSPMIDGVGADYTLSGGHNGLNGAGKTPAVQKMWLSAFRAARFVWITGLADRRIPWTQAILAYFHGHFRALTEGPDRLYVRTAG